MVVIVQHAQRFLFHVVISLRCCVDGPASGDDPRNSESNCVPTGGTSVAGLRALYRVCPDCCK